MVSELFCVDDSLNYVGFVEGLDLFRNKVDVVVCDGFVGNVVLKMIEGLVRFIMVEIKCEFVCSWWSRILSVLFVLFWL